jgi:ribonuclease E
METVAAQEAIAEPVIAPVAAPAPAPIVSPAPVQAPAHVETAPTADLGANLEQAGLVMIETAADKARAAEPIVVSAPALGRKPKPVAIIADEPLQIVETRRE